MGYNIFHFIMEFCPAVAEMLGKPKATLDGKYELYHTIGQGQFAK